MGDRVSIQFENKGVKSVVLFSHWGGMDFKETAEDYVEDLKARKKGEIGMPLDRLEPSVVMVDFIRHITKDHERVKGGYYLGTTENDGDNSDNGHHLISLGDEKEDEITPLEIANAMEKCGGSYVKAFGAALKNADEENIEKIKETWPEYWDHYTKIAKRIAKTKKQEEE